MSSVGQKPVGGAPSLAPSNVVHTSSHPSFPPAQSQQVAQFLLARNYYLTALELLVESQQAGRADEVEELQRFFNDTDKFPPEELAKHQNGNALDIQSQAREREERLQLSEYELRLAKEDLSEMNKRLTAALEEVNRQGAASNNASGVTTPGSQCLGRTRSTRAGSWSGEPVPECGALTVDPVQEDPPCCTHGEALIASPSHRSSYHQVGEEAGVRGPLLLDEGRPPTEQDLAVINSAVVTHLLKQGYRMSAITLGEEADVSLDTDRRNTASSGGVAPGPQGSSATPLHELDLWMWLQSLRLVSTSGGVVGDSKVPKMHEVELLKARDELADAQSYIIALQAECNEWKQKAQEATRQRTAIPSAPDSNSSPTTELSGSSVAGNGVSSENDAGSNAIGASGSNWPPVDPEVHAAQAAVVAQLCELLPRIIPNLTIKARLDVLSLLSSVILSVKALEPSAQRGLVSLVLNVVGNPDASQRETIVSHLIPIASAFGPSWTAVELLPMLVKQVSSPSSERRTCVANMMRAMVDLLDLSTQAHVVLTQLHRLSEDRIEQVREAAVGAVTTLLSRMPFSKSYYMVVEDMVMALIRDQADAIHTALTSSLLPVMQMWVINSDVIGTSLVPKLITEMGRHMEAATSASASSPSPTGGPPVSIMQGMAVHYSASGSNPGGGGQPSTSPSLPASGFGNTGGNPAGSSRRFPNHDYQVVYQLLGLYISMQPALRHSALRSCPAWALADAAKAYTPVDPLAGDIPTSDASALTDPYTGSGKPPRPSTSREDLFAHGGVEHAHRRTTTMESVTSYRSEDSTGPIRLTGTSSLNSLASYGRPLAMVDATQQDDVPPEIIFAVWALSEHHMQWKSLEWVVQFLIPEMLDAAKMVPLVPETLELRLQFARALGVTCECYGAQMTRRVIIPLMASTSGAQQTLQHTTALETLGEPVAPHIQEAAVDLLPRNPETTRLCRERVLPLFFGGVLPSAGVLGPYLSSMFSSADSVNRWVLESLAEIHLAVDFACELHSVKCEQGHSPRPSMSALTPELLQTLESLVNQRSVAACMCAVALLRGLLRTASSEQMSKRVMPSIMIMLGQGDDCVNTTCAWALLDVLLLFREDTKLVEQVFVVYDGLLDSGSHDVQMAVLACGSHLASAIAVAAARYASASVQLEWLLSAVQSLTQQLGNLGSSNPPRTAEQQRILATQLVTLVQQVHSFDIRLPRLQSGLYACSESLSKCRPLLADPQMTALNTILKDKNAFSPGAISDPKGEGLTSTAPPAALSATDESNGGGMLARFEVFRKKFRKGDAEECEVNKQVSQVPPLPTRSNPAQLLQTTPPPSSLGLPTSHQPPPPRAPSKSFLSDDEDDY